jgi:Fe-S-cluster containining protein
LTKRLDRFVKQVLEPEDFIDASAVPLEREGGPFVVPVCSKCTQKCCIHKEVGSGIMLSLRDVAQLIDSGYGDLIVGTFTFKRGRDGKLEMDKMPRLAKKQGYCVFYDRETELCGGYGIRPTICRRFPYEVHYRVGSGKPFARFIPWAPCPTDRSPKYEKSVRQMVSDSVEDENVSFVDATLLPEYVEELRQLGFEKVLPPPEDIPAARSTSRRTP